MASAFAIRPLDTLAEFDAAVRLQDAVWSYDEANRITQKVFLLASHIGGQVLGAYDGETLAGYAMALPGIRDGAAYLHSHHLAVLPAYRNAGLGRRLELAQREDALARGIGRMEWTFDPLETRNAHLNIARLGAIVRRYLPNFYGRSASPLQGHLPTDRLVAEWWMDSARVRQALGGDVPQTEPVLEIAVPAEVSVWKAADAERGRALALQRRNAQAFERGFSQGLAVLGFRRQTDGGGVYQLGRLDAVPAGAGSAMKRE